MLKSHLEEISLPTTSGTFLELVERSEGQSQPTPADSAADTEESQGFSQRSSRVVRADAQEVGKLDFTSLGTLRSIERETPSSTFTLNILNDVSKLRYVQSKSNQMTFSLFLIQKRRKSL